LFLISWEKCIKYICKNSFHGIYSYKKWLFSLKKIIYQKMFLLCQNMRKINCFKKFHTKNNDNNRNPCKFLQPLWNNVLYIAHASTAKLDLGLIFFETKMNFSKHFDYRKPKKKKKSTELIKSQKELSKQYSGEEIMYYLMISIF
jgi:hypothetical protein